MCLLSPHPGWLETLNKYSGLLSVAVTFLLAIMTGMYVWLTRQSLEAFRRSANRESEAKHLEDIKTKVVEPILRWLEHLQYMLAGQGAPNLITLTWSMDHSGEPWRADIHPGNIVPEFLDELLCRDASRHFRKEFDTYHAFRVSLESLLADITRFAQECSDDLWKMKLGVARTQNNPYEPFVNYESLLEAWIRCGVADLEPIPQYGDEVMKGVPVRFNDVNDPFVFDTRRNDEQLVQRAFDFVRPRWANSGLRGRVHHTLQACKATHQCVLSVQHMHKLPGDCEFLGARSGIRSKFWQQYARVIRRIKTFS